MKYSTDDFTDWHRQQGHLAQPFPYIFPQMPPRFRIFRAFSRGIFLLQRGFALLFFGSLAGAAFLVDRQNPILSLGILLSLILEGLFLVLRFAPGGFWRCPECRTRFPYYRPAHYRDTLVNADRIHTLEFLRIAYHKPKFCPLIFPAVCPACKKKFFQKAP